MEQDARKIILVVRPTRLDELIVRFNTVQQAQFYVEHLGADFGDYLAEQRQYQSAVERTETILRAFGRVQRLERRYLPNFIFGETDLVVVLGQDGLVANTLKYLDGQAVVGVNPDHSRWDGVLLPFSVSDLVKVMPEALAARRPIRRVTMAQATLNTGLTIHAVNDLFIGPRSHGSARYWLTIGEKTERQSSSGIIVSTGLGSTGWLKSLVAGAMGAMAALTGMALPPVPPSNFPWDADHLRFFVREPFPSRNSGASLVTGFVDRQIGMSVTSEFPEHGVIFSDGIENDYLEFNAGTTATIGLADRQGLLVV